MRFGELLRKHHWIMWRCKRIRCVVAPISEAVVSAVVDRTSTRFANQNHGILLPQIDPLGHKSTQSQTQSDLSRLQNHHTKSSPS